MQIPKSLTRATMEGHSLIGVLFGAIFYVLCLTGSVLVLVDQLTIWERPDAPSVTSLSADGVVAASRNAFTTAQAAGMAHDVYINMPSDELPRMIVYGYDGKGGHREWNGDASGHMVERVETPWVAFLQLLHFNLTLPGAIGRYIVGIFGTILLASIVTGLLAHRRILNDAFRLRWGGTRRLSNADLHNRIGVWALPFHLIVSLTGSLLGLAGLITLVLAMVAYKGDTEKAIASLLGPQAGEATTAAPPPDIAAMLRVIDARAPGAAITQVAIEHGGTAGQQVRIFAAAPHHLSRNEGFIFDAAGRLKWRAGFTDGNAGMRIYGMITPLHYGTYGGVILKLIYAVLGAGLTVIVASGVNIWLARRREQGRPAARLERLWAALLWGQPLVVALLALVLMVAPVPAIPAYWALTTLTWVAALLPGTRESVTLRFRSALGVAMVVLAVAHLGLRGWGEPVALVVDVALVVLGVAAVPGVLGWLRGVSGRKTRSEAVVGVS